MTKPKRPTSEQVEIAVMWLQVNAGDDGERDACRAVAAWLEADEFEAMLRRESRAAGVPVAVLRRRIAQQEATP